MEKPHVKDAELHEVIHVADNLRDADRLELNLSQGFDADMRILLAESLKSSTEAWSIMYKDEPIGCFGVSPISGQWGTPWLLGTRTLPRIAKEFIKQCPDYVERMHCRYANLMNYVHAENKVSIAWLEHLGFTVMPPVTIGSGASFRPFIKLMRYS